MSRFLSRDEWPLIVAGVTAGMLLSALVLYQLVTGIGGKPGLDPSLLGDTTRVVSPDVRRARGVVALFETGVVERLSRMQPSARPITGPLAISARDIVWNDRGGVRFARAEAGSGRLLTTGLAHGDIIVEDAVLERPIVALREERQGGWNFERVLAELLDGGNGDGNGEGRARSQRQATIHVRGLRIAGGEVDVQRPADRFAFHAVDGHLAVVSFSQPGIADPYVRVERISGVLERPAIALRLPITVANGLAHFPSGQARFDLETALLNETRLADVTGIWDPAQPGYGVTATGRGVAVRVEDIRFMAPDRLPETGTASLVWSVRPVAPNGTAVTLTEMDARSGDSRVRGDVAFTVQPEQFALRDAELQLDPLHLSLAERFTGPLPYGGTLTGRVLGTGGEVRFDLAALLTRQAVSRPLSAQLAGRVRLAGNADRPIELDLRFDSGTGVAELAGTVDLTGAAPRYDLTGSVDSLDLQAVVEPKAPPVFLTARFELAGTGTDPATADARLRLAGRFTGWRSMARDTVDLAAVFRSGVAHVESLALRLATAELAGRGEWRFIEPASGAVTYELAVTSLEPFGAYLPSIVDSIATGSFRASGNLAGSLERMRFTGEVTGSGLRAGGWAASSLATSYDVTAGAAVPDAVIELDSRGLETPMAGHYAAARLSLRLRASDMYAEFNADQRNDGRVEVVVTGEIPPSGERRALVERARFDLGRGRWQLVQPAEIRWGGADGLTVGNLELASEGSSGRALVSGRILPLDDADARVSIALFPVGELQRLIGRELLLEGMLSADGTVRGGNAPAVDLEFRVENGSFEQVPLTRLDGRVAYRDQQTQLHVVAAMDTAGSFELDARLPSVLRPDSGRIFRLLDGAPLDGSLTMQRFTIAPFVAAAPRVRELLGYLDGTVRLAGSAAQPRLEGTLTLRDGHVRIPELNQSFSAITGRIGFAGSRIVIEELRARSDGWLTARGDVVLEELTNPVVNVTFELDGFRPVGVPDERDATVDGSVSLTGPRDALVLTGDIHVEDGYVVLPQMGGGQDRDLMDITRPAPAMGQQMVTAGGEDWMRNLRIDNLRVRIGSNTWFVSEEARVELRGNLTVDRAGDAMPIVGTLEGERGQYTLIAGPIVRRFDVVAAQVRFVGGPEPNPFIDFTARRVIIDAGGRELNVDVRITGTLDRPNINLASGQLASLPEAELLGFLLFGQPSFELGGELVTGENLLEQTYLGGALQLAALELERELGGVGLDIFQIRLGSGSAFGAASRPTLVAGRQLANDVFLTVETGINALFGDAFALRLDWAFDRRSRVRVAREPVHRGRMLRPGLSLPLTPLQSTQQLLLEVRRRWEW
jgi:hypothetical protein